MRKFLERGVRDGRSGSGVLIGVDPSTLEKILNIVADIVHIRSEFPDMATLDPAQAVNPLEALLIWKGTARKKVWHADIRCAGDLNVRTRGIGNLRLKVAPILETKIVHKILADDGIPTSGDEFVADAVGAVGKRGRGEQRPRQDTVGRIPSEDVEDGAYSITVIQLVVGFAQTEVVVAGAWVCCESESVEGGYNSRAGRVGAIQRIDFLGVRRGREWTDDGGKVPFLLVIT